MRFPVSIEVEGNKMVCYSSNDLPVNVCFTIIEEKNEENHLFANVEGNYNDFTGTLTYAGTVGNVKNATFRLYDGFVNWIDGIWNSGIWKFGFWSGGLWLNGIWCDGVWENGKWEDGEWNGGTWNGGEWVRGVWRGDIWKQSAWNKAIYNGGEWEGKVWRGGDVNLIIDKNNELSFELIKY